MSESKPTPMREIVIPKHKAVFWLDQNGRWHNQHGEFEHPKIIRFFHAAIRKDAQGYHLFQQTEAYTEKVYFCYEDTALFVFDLIPGDDITLVLNTQQKVVLDPHNLFVQNDQLYLLLEGERVKFVERALMKLSRRLDHDGTDYWLRIDSGKTKIRVKSA